MNKFFRHIAFFGLWLAVHSSALAVDILTTAEHTFFEEGDSTRVGIEVEFKGLSLDEAAKLIQRELGGELALRSYTQLTTIRGYDEAGKALYNSMEIPFYALEGSSAGNIILKVENNQISDTLMAKNSQVVLELVTDPLKGMERVENLQRAVTALKNNRALGTDAHTAVSTQINVEIGGGHRGRIKVMDNVNLVRSYFRPDHRMQIEARNPVPRIRRAYVGAYSPGFMKRILDPNYAPKDWQEYYDDFIYRQSLEIKGVKGAWTMPIADARRKLLAMKNPIEPLVVKQNALRISSLMAYMVPDDPMSKAMVESGWIKPYPIVEFREFNNTFDVVKPTKQSLGLISAAKKYGYYDHDRLMEELSGVEAKAIRQLRERSLRAEKTGKPFSWRYFLADPKAVDVEEYEEHKNNMYRQRDLVGFLSPNERGHKPLYVPGESVIMHRRPIHAQNIIGKYNPGLINGHIAQAMENKYVEAKFFEEFAPGAMPKTRLLSQVVGKGDDAVEVAARLNKEFPNGWILKGVWDLGTEGMLVTDKMDVAGEIQKYRASDFEAFRKKLDADPRLKEAGLEYYLKELSAHPAYQGWRIEQMLKDASLFIVQDRMDIAKEFRVEVIGGKVLGQGSTIDRYAYKVGYDRRKSNVTDEDIRRIEKFTQDVVDKLPAELRGTPFAFDIAMKKDGGFGMVESNPGNNSNFLYEEDWKPSVKALSYELDHYPERFEDNAVHRGLSQEEQMKFLRKKFGEWGVNVKELYKGFTFADNGVFDNEFPEKNIDADEFAVSRGKDACANYYKLIAPVIKKGSLRWNRKASRLH